MDSLSNLPNEIICHIGSFLSAKEAAFAMVLSKRWRNLFSIVPELQFHRPNRNAFGGSVVDYAAMFDGFVDGVLALPVTTRIKKFSVKWGFHDVKAAQYDLINRCLIHVLKLGVMDLELEVYGNKEGGYSLPLEVFTCKTVSKLELGSRFAIDFLPADAYLPSLKTLSLYSVRFYEFGGCCAFSTLISAAPVLEELVIDRIDWERWKWSFAVSSLTLQRLTMRTIIEYGKKRHADDFNPMKLINGLKHVEILDLDNDTMEMIYLFGEAIPVFENLLCVSVNICNLCWKSLTILPKKCPKLKTVIIERGRNGYVCEECVLENGSSLSSCPLEVLKITPYNGSSKELRQMEYILGELSCLELVEVYSRGVEDERKLQVMEDLLTLPKASSKCKIEVKFS